MGAGRAQPGAAAAGAGRGGQRRGGLAGGRPRRRRRGDRGRPGARPRAGLGADGRGAGRLAPARRLGGEPAARAPEPYALELAGDAAGAAERWQELGCPYEAGLALADADEEAPLRRALDELRRLGAQPAADLVARRLRELGVRRLPCRPRRATAANPAGLTARELEVLALLEAGLRNAEIAARLHIAAKTVDHHVSAILAKLGVRSRRDAARFAAEKIGNGRSEDRDPLRM
ncbi:MAG TPA: LuxR C-terminal-related transcriptional regulator [Actinomycetota bacterium]|nr:LuxR C-terminal-related transcriptional regulator [Actinomycetota bacterium]